MANADVLVTKMSSKGQVVIPESLRKELNLDSGCVFIVYGNSGSNAILLKRLRIDDPVKEFERLADWGAAHAKKLGLDTRPQAIVRAQHKRRAKE